MKCTSRSQGISILLALELCFSSGCLLLSPTLVALIVKYQTFLLSLRQSKELHFVFGRSQKKWNRLPVAVRPSATSSELRAHTGQSWWLFSFSELYFLNVFLSNCEIMANVIMFIHIYYLITYVVTLSAEELYVSILSIICKLSVSYP
jgi:hypothetical protein